MRLTHWLTPGRCCSNFQMVILVFMKIIGHVGHFRWLGPNVWWEISQIWIEYIKPIRQMSDEPRKFFSCTVIFPLIAEIEILLFSCETAPRQMPQDLTDKSTLVQAMAWCCQAASYYLSQCWPKSAYTGKTAFHTEIAAQWPLLEPLNWYPINLLMSLRLAGQKVASSGSSHGH